MALEHLFQGSAMNAIDAKGRVSVPAFLRQQLAAVGLFQAGGLLTELPGDVQLPRAGSAGGLNAGWTRLRLRLCSGSSDVRIPLPRIGRVACNAMDRRVVPSSLANTSHTSSGSDSAYRFSGPTRANEIGLMEHNSPMKASDVTRPVRIALATRRRDGPGGRRIPFGCLTRSWTIASRVSANRCSIVNI